MTYLFLFVLISQLTFTMAVVFTFVLTGARGICIEKCICYAETDLKRQILQQNFSLNTSGCKIIDFTKRLQLLWNNSIIYDFYKFVFLLTSFRGIQFL